MWPRTLAVCALLPMLLAGCSALPGAEHDGYLEVDNVGSLPSELGESSALSLHGEQLWTLNDSGNGPWLYRMDGRGRVAQRVRLGAAANIDWESMAADEETLYVADCGNNSGRREWLQLYAIPWHALVDAEEGSEVAAKHIEFRFGDPTAVAAPQAHDNDCEAVALVGDRIWLLTKGWASSTSRLYRLDPGLDRQSIHAVTEWPVRGLVTGLDYSESRKELVVLGYTLGRLSSDAFIWRIPVDDGEPDWSRARRNLLWPSGQWEAVAWQGDDLVLTRENSLLGEARLGRVKLR